MWRSTDIVFSSDSNAPGRGSKSDLLGFIQDFRERVGDYFSSYSTDTS